MLNGGLSIARSNKEELGLTLTNSLDQTLWINVLFQTPNGLTDCLLSKELGAQTEHFYVCPQTRVQAEMPYQVQVKVYGDLEQTQLLDAVSTEFRFSAKGG